MPRTPRQRHSAQFWTTMTTCGTFATVNYPANCNGNCSIIYTTTKAKLVLAAALPLELLSFEAQVIRSSVQLDWRTAQEKNMRDFDIQRSENGTTWQSIGNVKAKNQFEENSYQFIEEQIPATSKEQIYYRLKMNDTDGTFTYSPIVSVQRSGGAAFTVSPNPTSGLITLRWAAAPQTAVSVNVVNSLGQTVRTSALPENTALFTLDLSDLSTGIYYIIAGTYVAKVEHW